VQIGLTSFGSQSCLAGPSGYTRVTSYLSWISGKIGKLISLGVYKILKIT